MKTFTATIYGADEDEVQDVIAYIVDEDETTCDVEILLPIQINTSAMRSDIQEHLREVSDKRLGTLTFTQVVKSLTFNQTI